MAFNKIEKIKTLGACLLFVCVLVVVGVVRCRHRCWALKLYMRVSVRTHVDNVVLSVATPREGRKDVGQLRCLSCLGWLGRVRVIERGSEEKVAQGCDNRRHHCGQVRKLRGFHEQRCKCFNRELSGYCGDRHTDT